MATRTAFGTAYGTTTGASVTLTGSITLTEGDTLVVGGNSSGNNTISSITWSGSSLAQGAYYRVNDACRSWIYVLPDAPAGTGDIVVNWPSSGTWSVRGWIVKWSDVQGIDRSATAFAGTQTITASLSAANNTQIRRASQIILANMSSDASAGVLPVSWSDGFENGLLETNEGGDSAGESYKAVSSIADYFTTASIGVVDDINVVLVSLAERFGTSARTQLTTGFTSPIQFTSGSDALAFYTPPLKAVTLAGIVRATVWAGNNVPAANAAVRVEVAVVNGDGSNATIFGAGNVNIESLTYGGSATVDVAGSDIAITAGQRVRVRFFADDYQSAMGGGTAARLYYNGTTAGTWGDTYLQFPVTLEEEPSGGTLDPFGMMGFFGV